jgi:hypothetical protein
MWPRIPAGQAIVAVVSILYGADEKTNWRIGKFAEKLAKLPDFQLHKPASGGSRQVNGLVLPPFIVLPPFNKINRVQMETWIERPEVQKHFKSWEAAQDQLGVIFPQGVQHRMQPLAQEQLPIWLRHCRQEGNA